MLEDGPKGKPVANNLASDGRAQGWQGLKALVSFPFWQRNFNYLIAFAPKCLLPAALVNGALILLLVGNLGFYKQMAGGAAIKFNDLIRDAAICLFATGIGLTLFVVGFSKWLFVLTAFCRYWFNLEREASGSVCDLSILKTRLADALAEVKARGSYLREYWMQLLIIMLAPILALYLLAALKIANSHDLVGGALVTLPQPVDAVLLPLCVVIAVFILIISFLSLPVAAFQFESPKQSVKLVFLLAKNNLLQVLLLTMVVVALNILLGAPLAFWRLDPLKGTAMADQAVQLCIVQEVWQGILSTILLPLSLVPFCQLLKDLAFESA